MITIHKELTDQLCILAYLKFDSNFEPENIQGQFHYREQEHYSTVMKEVFITNSEGSRIITLNNEVLSVVFKKSDHYCYRITFSDGSLLLLSSFPYFNQPFAKIIIKQPSVWTKPYDRAHYILQFLETTFGKIVHHVLSVDIAVHFSGWSPTIEDRMHFSGRVKAKDMHQSERGHVFSGFTFGSKGKRSKSIYGRVYNKSLELRSEHGSPRPFFVYDVPAELTTEVWNMEFHFPQRCLKSFNLRTLDEVQRSYQRLWKYATYEYLKHKALPRTSKSFCKCDLSLEWKRLQNCFSTTEAINSNRDKPGSSGYDIYKLNKLKKNILNFAKGNHLELEELNAILRVIETTLSMPSSLYNQNWKDFVQSKVNPKPLNYQIRSLDI